MFTHIPQQNIMLIYIYIYILTFVPPSDIIKSDFQESELFKDIPMGNWNVYRFS